MPEKHFPIIWPYNQKRQQLFQELGCPRSVPWSFVKDHELCAIKNHEQTLDNLARRGGLDPCELLAVIRDKSWTEFINLTDKEAITALKEELATHHG